MLDPEHKRPMAGVPSALVGGVRNACPLAGYQGPTKSLKRVYLYIYIYTYVCVYIYIEKYIGGALIPSFPTRSRGGLAGACGSQADVPGAIFLRDGDVGAWPSGCMW